MQCDQLQQRLDELLDRRADLHTDAQLESHLADCADCRRLAGAYEAMLWGVNLLGILEPGDLVASQSSDGTVAALVPRPDRAASGYLTWVSVVAVAATLLIAALNWRPILDRPPTSDPAPRDVAMRAHTTTSLLPEDALARMWQATGQNLAVLPQTVLRVASLPETDRIVGHIRPFTEPVGATWEALLRAWPGTTAPTQVVPEADTSLIRWRRERYA